MDLIQPSGEHNLDEVRVKFKQWRNRCDKRKTIPEALWEAAASLYPAHSLAPHIKNPASQPHQAKTLRPGTVTESVHADGIFHRS